MLACKNVTKIYGVKGSDNKTIALDKLSLEVQSGEFVGIMGPSGSGKSTLLSAMGGIININSGEILLNNKNIENLSQNEIALFRRNHMGFVFQDFNLMDGLTIKENVALPLILNKEEGKKIENKINEIMKFFSIEDIKDKYPWNVSGGQQQRAAIARAIIHKPQILFADEPTGNIDSKASEEIMTSFKHINEEKGGTILMVTHDPLAASYCNRITFIRDGTIFSELDRKGDQKSFYHQIIASLKMMGGITHEI
ncbi:putative ABC transport system ATP-binding protein [Natranaerovirga pectinivora]|uniref:Putative ABC transport system ATP-binding protein n=1 Tax=Natranaerovirga pectinivora TaxID=682400 RepID=A0A4R3MQP9_9FIRM|nr:ABC transporter ATP-binding protein [Natranaerovirga pectinivora]TCT16226.1 putative ABC transport system ATP-binding protein [Natranaerovirga pectinivora]